MVATNGDRKGAVIVNGYCDLFPVSVCDCVFRHFFRGEGGIFTPKNLQLPPPPSGCQNVRSKSFFRPEQRVIEIYRGNSLLVDNKHGKLFVV